MDIGVPIYVTGVTQEERPVPVHLAEVVEYQAKDESSLTDWPRWVIRKYVSDVRELKCFETVREMLIQGVTSIEIGKHIKRLGEMKHLSDDAARQRVEHYKATVPKGILMAKRYPHKFAEIQTRVEKSFNVLDELKSLYELQMSRVRIQHGREKTVNFLLSGGERQVMAALEVVREIAAVQERIGGSKGDVDAVFRSTSAQIDWDAVYSRPGANAVLSDPQKRARVVRFLENAVSLANGIPEGKEKAVGEMMGDGNKD